ncbi:Ribosomal protein S8e/ribosomal biogenesis NSA2 [Carpediemonas membranifera]|uniref:40S ribosomal protein S8 n=1 Tax=Carpediemonas membranifera TaxID=201153 RepID=A0A8J6E0V8_9EUKA|nr:Ribosomal protein S8e/ribosomal biogenesis NSA2 [Carpediemonas membranifera]|eukprot:KAG9392708.1 Ribosomal protein S8e/ribosomal biogenesis NSA2 [Carpediemonas membranifera]
MAISRDSVHKRKNTGGRVTRWFSKRRHCIGRPAANTKLGAKKTTVVTGRGGNQKFRALRLDSGNFSWATEVCARKVRILEVAYNATSNELVRTKTLTKGTICYVEATPFRAFYEQKYGVQLEGKEDTATDVTNKSEGWKAKRESRREGKSVDEKFMAQFANGRLLAMISSRPGQCGRADGYLLEGRELEFYERKTHK